MKLTTLLRTSKVFDVQGLIDQFKSRILGYIEYRTSAIYHADATTLLDIERQYGRFLKAIGISKKQALDMYKLAPLNARRDMAMLGVIHRAVLGEGPAQIQKYFQLSSENLHPNGRNLLRRHNRQLSSYRKGKFLETTARSILGLVDVYNMLPQKIVDAGSVKIFQGMLQGLMKEQGCSADDWETLFSPRHALHAHPLARLLSKVGTTGTMQISMPSPGLETDSIDMGDTSDDRPPSWW